MAGWLVGWLAGWLVGSVPACLSLCLCLCHSHPDNRNNRTNGTVTHFGTSITGLFGTSRILGLFPQIRMLCHSWPNNRNNRTNGTVTHFETSITGLFGTSRILRLPPRSEWYIMFGQITGITGRTEQLHILEHLYQDFSGPLVFYYYKNSILLEPLAYFALC